MRVIVYGECSGRVRDAFIARGHDAWSCDLLPTEKPGPHLIMADDAHLLEVLRWGTWDMGIGFLPCTHLAVSGARYFAVKRASGQQQAAVALFTAAFNSPIPRMAAENPIGVLSRYFRKPDQIIQPWQFGHPESKATCLWLRGLPKLTPTNILAKPACGYWSNQTPSGQNKLGPSPTRAADRSRTYQGIADAMAAQWNLS